MTDTERLRALLDERDELCVYGLIQRDLRELGVEVDG